MVVLPKWAQKVSNWCNTPTSNIVSRYYSFVLAAIVSEVSSVILNFHEDNKNSSGFAVIKQGHFKFVQIWLILRRISTGFNFTQYFSAFLSSLLFIHVLGEATHGFVLNQSDILAYAKILHCRIFLFFGLIGDVFAKCHTP